MIVGHETPIEHWCISYVAGRQLRSKHVDYESYHGRQRVIRADDRILIDGRRQYRIQVRLLLVMFGLTGATLLRQPPGYQTLFLPSNHRALQPARPYRASCLSTILPRAVVMSQTQQLRRQPPLFPTTQLTAPSPASVDRRQR